MNQTKINFESQNLTVDFLSINISSKGNNKHIAKYLFENFYFNSTFSKGHNETSEKLFYSENNTLNVSLIDLRYDPSSKSFWEGTKLVSKDVADATIMVKMGVKPPSNNEAETSYLALTAIPLDGWRAYQSLRKIRVESIGTA